MINIKNSAYIKAAELYDSCGEILRIAVKGGGCSGFEYEYSTTKVIESDDIIFEQNNTRIVIDKISLRFLDEAEVEFINDISSSKFVITNPNVSSKCGCGNSFAI